eukprot:1936415-Rhodomonas_salina.2
MLCHGAPSLTASPISLNLYATRQHPGALQSALKHTTAIDSAMPPSSCICEYLSTLLYQPLDPLPLRRLCARRWAAAAASSSLVTHLRAVA